MPVVTLVGAKGLRHRRNALRASAALVLIAGFVALSNGSITVAPILLVIAYAILIPAVILA